MARNYSNIAFDTTLTAGIAAGDLTCVVASASGWPSVPFAAVLDPGSLTIEEVVQVTLVVGTTFTITRGFDGTTAAAHANGATVRHAAIAGDFTDLQAADALLTPLARTLTINGVAFDLSANRSWTVGDAIKAIANVFTAHNAFGANAAVDSYAPFSSGLTFSTVLVAAEEMTIAGTMQRAAIGAYLKFNPVGAAPGNTFAIDAEVETTAGNVQTHGTNLIGVFGSALHKNAQALTNIRGLGYFAANQAGATVSSVQGIFLEAQNTGSGVATNLTGLDVNLYNQSSAVTTNAYGVKIAAPINSGGAAITNNYGVHIGNITGGVTLNYAILTNGGQVRHLTGAAAVIGQVIQGATSQSANLTEWQDVSANVLGSVSPIGAALFRPRDAVTNTVTPALTLGHESTGTPAASFGTRLLMQLESTTTSDQDAAAITAIWTTATHASRTSALIFSSVNNAGALAEMMRIHGGSNVVFPSASGIAFGTPGSVSASVIVASSLLRLQGVSGVGLSFFTNNSERGRWLSAGTGNLGVGIVAPTTQLHTATTDAATAAVTNVLTVGHNSSGTPAAGFGVGVITQLESTTTEDTTAADEITTWVVATHASRTARRVRSIYDTAARETMREEASGTAPMIGFLGANAAIRQTGGVATAGGTYGATEQVMLQTAYDALRTFGFLT